MLLYAAQRVVRALFTILGVVTLVFLLVRILPGDPVELMLGDLATAEDRKALRASLRLDDSLLEQYFGYLADIADVSLGYSFRKPAQSVGSMIAEVAPQTLELAGAALVVAWALALVLGSVAAARQHTWVDRLATGIALVGLAIPVIWLGPLLLWLFGVELRWLPLPGDAGNGLQGLVLPATTLGFALCAVLTRQTRGAMLEVLRELYILAAKARGISPISLHVKHALRNALLPVLPLMGAQLGALLSGAVIAEKIFERPGLGTLFIEAFLSRDMPVIQGCVFVSATGYVLVNLFMDIGYGLLDPRIRLS